MGGRGEGGADARLLAQLGAQRAEISAAVGALRTLRRLERAVGSQALSRRILQRADCVSSANVVALARALQREQATLDRFQARRGASGGRGERGGRGEQELQLRVFRDWLTKCLGRKWELAAEEMAGCHWAVHASRASLAAWRVAAEAAAVERGRRLLEGSARPRHSVPAFSPPATAPAPASPTCGAAGPGGPDATPPRIARVQRSIERVRGRVAAEVGGPTKNQFALVLEQVSRLSSSLNKFMLGAETQIQHLEGKIDNWQEQTLQYVESSSDSCGLLLRQANLLERRAAGPERLTGSHRPPASSSAGGGGHVRRDSDPAWQEALTSSLVTGLVQGSRRGPFVPV